MVEADMAGVLGLLVLGAAVLVALRLVNARLPQLRDDPVSLILAVTGWVLVALALVGALVLLMPGFGLVLGGAMVIVSMMAMHRGWRARQYALLSVLAVAVERRMPLVPAIEAFAQEQPGALAARLRGLAERLKAGVPLPVALWESRGAIPPEALVTIRVGYESGMLAPALRQAVAARNFEQPLRDAVAGKVLYLCFVLWFGIAVMTFMMLRILPAMEKIFYDFETELPPATRCLAEVGAMLRGYALLPWLAVMLLFLYAVLHYCGIVRRTPPGVGRLLRRRDAATILDALALVARQRRPILDGLASLAEAYPRGGVRRRLALAAADVAAGADWCQSLFRRGLIGRADMAILQAAERVGHLDWALGEMAESNRRRLNYRLTAVLQVLFPLVLVAMGLVVMVIVVGYFVPLVELIRRLTPGV